MAKTIGLIINPPKVEKPKVEKETAGTTPAPKPKKSKSKDEDD